MSVEPERSSRRTILAAALGATAAAVAGVLGRPPLVRAGGDGDVVLGTENRSPNQTSILIDHADSGTTAFQGWTYGTGLGIEARSLLGTGLRASTDSATAIGLVAANTKTGGTGLSVTGKARFDRSGVATAAKGKSYVDITVPGGLTANSIVLATLQTYRPGVAVSSVRRNYPSSGHARIYLTKVPSTTSSTAVGWLVIA